MPLVAGQQPLAAAPDLALIRRYAELREATVFAELVRRHASFVFATAVRILGDAAMAEDVAQETFFRLLRSAASITGSVPAWLHRAATRLAVDALRSESCRRRRELVYSVAETRPASAWSELSPYVDEALSEMPEATRQLLVEHFLMGRTQTELAAESRQSAATISRRIHRGLAEIQDRLRRKGVMTLPMLLAVLLRNTAARPIPATLARELGKMTMFSAASAGGGLAAPRGREPMNLSTKLIAGSCALSLLILMAQAVNLRGGRLGRSYLPAESGNQQIAPEPRAIDAASQAKRIVNPA